MREKKYVWDPAVRLFHWGLVGLIATQVFLVDQDSDLHLVLGYIIAGLIGFRLVWGFVGSRHARFSDFPPDPHAAMGQLSDIATGRHKHYVGHNPLGALMIYNLLGSLVVIAASGYMMGTMRFFGVEWVEELHELMVVWMQFSVVIHVGAVLVESRRSQVNLPKAMVTGYKVMPTARE